MSGQTRSEHALPVAGMVGIGCVAGGVAGAVGVVASALAGGAWPIAAGAGVVCGVALGWPAWTVRGWRVRDAGMWMTLIIVWQTLSAASALLGGVVLYSASRSGLVEAALVLAGGYLIGVIGQAVVYHRRVQSLPRSRG